MPPALRKPQGDGFQHIVRPRHPLHFSKAPLSSGAGQRAAIRNGQDAAVLDRPVGLVLPGGDGGMDIGHADIVPGQFLHVSLGKGKQPIHINGRDIHSQNGTDGNGFLIDLMAKILFQRRSSQKAQPRIFYSIPFSGGKSYRYFFSTARRHSSCSCASFFWHCSRPHRAK